MNARYVEAMARAIAPVERESNDIIAVFVLSALITELRADPAAVRAMADALLAGNHGCIGALNGLCDYLAGP